MNKWNIQGFVFCCFFVCLYSVCACVNCVKDAAVKAEPSSQMLIACGPVVRGQVHLHASILQQGYFIPLFNLANTTALWTVWSSTWHKHSESCAGGHEGMKKTTCNLPKKDICFLCCGVSSLPLAAGSRLIWPGRLHTGRCDGREVNSDLSVCTWVELLLIGLSTQKAEMCICGTVRSF